MTRILDNSCRFHWTLTPTHPCVRKRTRHTSFAIQSVSTRNDCLHTEISFIRCICDVINRIFVLTRFWDIDWRSWMETRSRQRPTNSIIQTFLLFIYVYHSRVTLWSSCRNSVIHRIIIKKHRLFLIFLHHFLLHDTLEVSLNGLLLINPVGFIRRTILKRCVDARSRQVNPSRK